MKSRNIACMLLMTALLCACGKTGDVRNAHIEVDGGESGGQTAGEEEGNGGGQTAGEEAGESGGESGWQTVGKEEAGGRENGEASAKEDGENTGNTGSVSTDQALDRLSGNALEGLVRIGEDPPYYCNTEANIRLCYLYDPMQWRCNLVCRDPVYGITYYVNYGRDDRIYALLDNETDESAKAVQLAVPIPAMDLYCRDGRLYFIARSYKEAPADLDGYILCYDPQDGSVKAVMEQKAERMNVYQDGIILESFSGDRRKTYYYSFESKTLTELQRYGRDRVGEYRMMDYERKDPGLSENEKWIYALVDAQGNVVKEFTPLPSRMTETQLALDMFRIEGNVLYYQQSVYKDGVRNNNWSFMEYHTDTGECRAMYPIRTDEWYHTQGADFIMYDGLALFTSGYCLDLATGETSLLEWHDKPEMTDQDNYLDKKAREAFYTDGERLFYLYDEKLYLLELRKKETAKEISLTHNGEERRLIYEYEASCSEIGK